MCGSIEMAMYIAARLEIGVAPDYVLLNNDAKYYMEWDAVVMMNHSIFPIEIIGDLPLFDNHKSNMSMIQIWSCDLSLESWECALDALLVHSM